MKIKINLVRDCSGDWVVNKAGCFAWFCPSGIAEYFDIREEDKMITVVISDEEHADSYKVVKDNLYGSVTITLSNGSKEIRDLTGSMDEYLGSSVLRKPLYVSVQA